MEEVRRFFVWALISLISGLGTCNLCPSSDTESLLQVNNVYTYRFRSEALAQAVGTTEDHGKITLECDVHIAHETACYYNLDLHNCVVTAAGGEPGSQTAWIDHQPLPDLSKYPVAFALSNGEINEVKTHDEDPLYYVNIKRGVLSAFVFKLSQTKQEMHEDRTDIHGICPLSSIPVDYSQGAVKTSKDMLHCHFPSRPDWQFSPWSLFWNMSFIQHVINSTTDCEYNINEPSKRIEKVFCKERHAIMLESTHRTTTAVQTNIFYHLDFVKLEVQTSKPAFPTLTRKTSIQFEYEHTPLPLYSPRNFLPIAKKMLSDLVLDSVDEIRLFTIPQFTDFVGWIRSSHNLRPLVDSVKDCSFLPDGKECDKRIKDLAYSYLSDALLQCNNLPCAKSLTYLVTNNDLSPTYLNFLFHSWSYMHYSKPGFIRNFVDICRLKNSPQCWISLGSFVRRIASKNDDLDEKVLQEVTEVATYFYNRIAEECKKSDSTDKPYADCLAFLKAASDIGEYYNRLVPEGCVQLLDIATDEHVSVIVRTSALEATKDGCIIWIPEQRAFIYDRLLPLLKNSTLTPSIRILAFDQIMHVLMSNYDFDEDLLTLLESEQDTDAEVILYIANHLNRFLKYSKVRSSTYRFHEDLPEKLRQRNISLDSIVYNSKAKSKSTTYDMFLNFPFMPDYLKKFGVQFEESSIYDSYIYPTIFNKKTVFQLFSTFLPATKLGTYFEGWEELILAFQKNLADMNGQPLSFGRIAEALMKTLGENGQGNDGSLRNINENIISNVKKLQQLYWEHHKKLSPFAKAYLDLFGSTLKYYVQEKLDPAVGQQAGKLLQSIVQSLAEGVNYDTTRVIRVIEAYHQVPTMMGLPLNWTTNATLAFSIRAGLKYQMNREDNHIYAKGSFQPSAALTFLNRMVLDFPTLTQIGVQANSSGFTSTDLKAQFSSAKGKQTFRFDRPSRTQKVLELFRTNQLIKHNNYEDIPDWDIDRTSSSWCTKDNSATGLKFCLSKSYPKVTDRIKPWAVMAGWCKWQFLVHPSSGKDVHYDLELQQASNEKEKEFTAKLNVVGKDKENSATFKAVFDESGKDTKLELKTTLLPDFKASFTRSELSKSKKVTGHKVEAALKLFKDFKYELEYSNEGKVQKSSAKANQSPDENSQTLVNEEHTKIKTPYSVYEWRKTFFKLGENTKAEASLSYENTKGKSDWMKNLLPTAFWEDDRKAYFKIQLHWKKPIWTEDKAVTRETVFLFKIPRYAMNLHGYSFDSDDREQILVNFGRTDLSRGKIDAFMNFTFDYWTNGAKYIYASNLTIPRKSWSASLEWEKNAPKYHTEIELKRASMKPISDMERDYVGWWTQEVSDRFKIEEHEVKLVADVEKMELKSGEVVRKYPEVAPGDIEGLKNSVYVTKVVLHYPFNSKIETVDFDGYFMISSSGWMTDRFQKTFNMTSTYNNLRLTSHSVVRTDYPAVTLYHKSYFTHITTDTKAYNTIHFSWKDMSVGCWDMEFDHDIRSHVFDLSTSATYRCETADDKLHTLRLNINTNSSEWNMLDIKLDQIVQDISRNYTKEEMTTYHALGTLHVDAEWFQEPKKHHQKQVVLCGKDGNCPNAQLFLDFWPGFKTIKFSRPDYDITCRFSSGDKKVHFEVIYGDKVEGNSKQLLDFGGEILGQNYHLWEGDVYVDTYYRVRAIVGPAYLRLRNAIVDIARDKNHPLNEMVKPALKMTLYDYWQGLKEQYRNFYWDSWAELKEIFYTIDAFTEPAYALLVNSVTNLKENAWTAYNFMSDRTVTVWAINYFELPRYLKEGFYSLPQALRELWKQLAVGEDNVLHIKFLTGRLFALDSFYQWPRLHFDLSDLKDIFSSEKREGSHTKKPDQKQKVAMIFGPLHVYTFDEHLYDIPEYPHADCKFLLAHDVHGSLFTAISSEKGIDVLFPEMRVTINDQNEVFINGSQQASSLPIQASNGKVSVKRGPHMVEVWSPSLTVICRSQDFLCILKLSDYHTGGTFGLLGNADGITNKLSKNDLLLPNGKASSDLVEFAKAYEISGKPECQNLAAGPEPPTTDEEATGQCSELTGCSDRPDIVEKFLRACVTDVRASRGPCYAAAGLSALCSLKYKPTHTTCNVKKQEKEAIGRNLEVILVVQETKYLTSSEKSNAPLIGIESLIKAVDGRFREAGYDSIRYSLIGFGGSGVHYAPSIHSPQKDIWVHSEAMINDVLQTLEFKSKQDADALQALKYALEELGHDSFVSKVVIVIAAKDKLIPDKPVMNFIQNHLEENGITLYTLSSYPSIEKGKKVFGVRADGLIFPSQTKDGDAYLDYPRGNLAKLTSSTRGSVFLTKFLKDNKPSVFFSEFAQEVWAKVNKESKKCRSCKSVRSGWWWYSNECNIVQCQ